MAFIEDINNIDNVKLKREQNQADNNPTSPHLHGQGSRQHCQSHRLT